MPPRLYVGPAQGLREGVELSLPEGAARHVQVLRLQPGDSLRVFDGVQGEWLARVMSMGRREVLVSIEEHVAEDVELAATVTLAMGVPTQERMDSIVEKVTELGVSIIQPLMCERSVLRLEGERAARKVAHWQAVAVAACEQSGRTRVPLVRPVMSLRSWLAPQAQAVSLGEDFATRVARGVLSLRDAQWVGDWLAQSLQGHDAQPQAPAVAARSGRSARSDRLAWAFLSGPEGGLSEAEDALARAQGWSPLSLGPRVLRADTAPMAIMSLVALQYPPA